MQVQISPRRCLVVVAAALAALATAGTASAHSSDPQLLRAYQPVTVFDPTERFRPTNVRSFVEGADLERYDASFWTVVAADPKPSDLGKLDAGVWRLNQDSCSPAAALGGLSCYADASAARSGKNVVYSRVARLPNSIVLQYWFFYYDDVYSYFYPPTDVLWQAHEGDWEVVNVVLSTDEQPVEVGSASASGVPGTRRRESTARILSSTSPLDPMRTTPRPASIRSTSGASHRRCSPCSSSADFRFRWTGRERATWQARILRAAR